MSEAHGYRDKVYIIKDIILTLGEYGELNQTALLSFCGLNLTKHRKILEDLESHEMITKEERIMGKRTISIFKATAKGNEFCRTILEPYEDLFPRKTKSSSEKKLRFLILT
ncbi:MAG: hypothetical protein ACE5RN_08575 [Nitrosopumilaceae archaeon]